MCIRDRLWDVAFLRLVVESDNVAQAPRRLHMLLMLQWRKNIIGLRLRHDLFYVCVCVCARAVVYAQTRERGV